MKQLIESRKGTRFGPLRTRMAPLLPPLSFLVSINAAYASGANGQPPVVVHPSTLVAHTVPVSHQTNNQLNNSSGNSGTNSSNGNSTGTNAGGATGVSSNGKSSGQSKNSSLTNPGGGHTSASAAANIQTPSNNSVTTHTTALPTGYQLDLSSTTANIVLGSSLFGKSPSVSINIGGTTQIFTPGQKVTGAEYVAIQQQLANNNQTIVLNAQGAADGGKFNLNSTVNASVNELVVPTGVTAIDNFSKNSSLTVAGDLLNYGSIYGISTNSHTTAGTLSAYDITNETGGVISTVLPSTLAASIPDAVQSVSLALNAQNNLGNAGTISSSGSVSLSTTHGFITNSTGASVTAANDVNLNVGNGNLTNAGHITANTGNINISAPDSTDLNINATGGTFTANAGNINVRTPAYAGSNNINLSGGNYLSQNVNLNSGNGAITGVVGQVSGNLNSQAGVEHVFANSSNLDLGNNTVKGDPTFATTGNIIISGSNSFGEAVVILAQGNITGDTGAAIIDSGNNVTLIAGATVSTTGTLATTGSTIPTTADNISGATGTGNGMGSFTASVDFSTPTGGNIDLHTSTANNIIDTHSSSVAAGNVTLVAEASSNLATGGQIILPTGSNIYAAYNGISPNPGNGNVTMIAPNGITTSSIQNGSGAGAANILLVTAQPKSSDGSLVVFNQNGVQTSSNSIAPDYTKIGTGSITIGGVLASTGNISITAGGGALTLPLVSIQGNGSFSATAPGAITLNAGLQGPGGITLVSGSNITSAAGISGQSITSSTFSSGLAAGNMTIVAGANYTDNGSTVIVNGASANGGIIDFSTHAPSAVSAISGNSGFSGGNITLVAFENNLNSGGTISVGPTISTSGNGGGANGSFVAVAGQSSGTSINLSTVTTSGGTGSGGNVEIDATSPSSSAVTISQATGGITSGDFRGGAFAGATATATTVNLNNNGSVTMMGTGSGGAPSIGTLNVSGAGNISSYTLSSSNFIALTNAITAGSIELTSTNVNGVTTKGLTATGTVVISSPDGNISYGGPITAPGGLLMIAGGNIGDSGGTPNLSTASSTGNAGNMTIVSGAAYTQSGGSFTITGASGLTGGFADAGATTVTTASSNGKGGNLNIISFNGNIQTGNDANAPQVSTGGSGSNKNGNILAIAQTSEAFSDSDEIVLPPGVVSTTGGTGGGGNITAYTSQPNAGTGITISTSTCDLPVGAQATLITGTPGTGNVSFGPVNMPSGSTMTLSAGSSISTYAVNLAGGSFIATSGTNGSNGGNMTFGSGGTSITANTILATAVAGGTNINCGISSLGILTAPGGIVLVATGNLSLEGGVSTAALNPGNITLIAGAAFTQVGNLITITGQNNSNGGDIGFPISGVVNTQTTASGIQNANGGNFNALAFGGSVNLQGVPVTTGGFGTGSNGNVLIIAGGSGGGSGASMDHPVNTTGGSGGGGNLTIQTATPNATNLVISTTTSDISSGTPAVGSTPLDTAINFGSGSSITVNNATIALTSGGQVNLEAVTGTNNTILNIAANLTLGNENNINIGQAISVNQITATIQSAAGLSNSITIDSTGPITAPGGILLVAGGEIFSNVTLSTASSGNSGNITAVAGAAFTENATSITVTGESPQGASPLDLAATLTTATSGSNKNGGNINLIAFGGQINIQGQAPTTTGGSGTGTNGNFTAVAGGVSGNPILLSSVDTTGGAAGTGNVTLLTAVPNTTPNVVISKTTSDISTGSFLGGTPVNDVISVNGVSSSTITANGAAISLTTAGTIDPLTITNASTAGNGGSVSLAGSTMTLNQSSITVNGVGASGKGGNITLNFGTLNYTNQSSVPLALNANGAGTGNGGVISVTTTATTTMEINNTVPSNTTAFEFNAASGASGGNGGSATFITGGNLTVNTAALVLTPHGNGNGQTIILTAGNGAGPGLLDINSGLSANGVGTGHGGTIDLQSNSTANFLINTGASGNAVAGALTTSAATSANEGTISVVNTGGAVVQLLPINTASSVTLVGSNAGSSGGSGVIVGNQLVSPTGTIVVTATTGNVTYNTVAEAIFAGTSISLSAGPSGGTIGTAATPLSLDAPTVNIPGSSSLGVVNLLNFADGGQFLNTGPFLTNGNFTYIGSGNITINGSTHNVFGSATGNVTITSALLDAGDVYGNITLGGNLSSGAAAGVVSLTTGGAFGFTSLQPTASAQAPMVNLATGSGSIGAIGTPFQVNATNLSVTGTGLVDINNSGTTPINLTNANTTAGFILTSQGQININTGGLSNAAAIVLQAQNSNGGVAINNVNLGGASTTGGITLSANGSGLLSETGSGTVIGNGPMSLSAQTGGIFLNINTTGNLTATGTGVVSLGNLNFGTDTVTSGSGGTKWTYGSNGSLILNTITVSNGFIDILAAGNLLQVNGGSAIGATNGQIILENANTASGSIVIGANSFIHTAGTGASLPVNIVIGAVPTSPIAGTSPSNFHLGTNTGGTIYFGANSIANPSSVVTYNLAGSNIVFNTGTRPASAISVGGGSTITADPVGFIGSAVTSTPSIFSAGTDNGKQIMTATASLPSFAFSAANGSSQPSVSGLASFGSETPSGNTAGINSINAGSAPAISTASALSSNSGLTSAVNSAAVLNAILGGISDISSNASNYLNNAGAGQLPPNKATDEQWISETEIINGQIPAVLSTDDEMGVKQGITTVVDMDEEENETRTASGQISIQTSAQTSAQTSERTSEKPADQTTGTQRTTPLQRRTPLQGAVSHTAGAARVVNLKTGSVVFAPRQDTVVNTPFGTVQIDAKSIVMIMALRQGIAVFTLDASHSKAVSIQAGDRKLTLAPGLHALITDDSVKDFADLNPAQLIGHRNLRAESMGSHLQAYVSEFSVPQAVAAVVPLKQLMSTRHPHGQKVAGHLLKTTALLLQTHQGDYEQINRRTFTACSN